MRLPVLIALLSASSIAHASTITDTISFTATGQVAASGSYTLTFDPTLTYSNQTAGLTVNSFNDTFSASIPTGFTYQNGALSIGGLLNTVGAISSNTNDYFVYFTSFASVPTFGQFVVASPDISNQFYSDNNGTVTVTAASVTPEPSALILFGTGAIGILGAARRKYLRG
jgi:hypothetical protein